MQEVSVHVPAKVNLGLAVGPRGSDGYHELVNVFHAVSLYDQVTALPADGFAVAVDPADSVPDGDTNLAIQAARLLAQQADVPGGVELRIDKSIPIAGGMAGGSADAAAALVACDALWKTGCTSSELLELASQLGADVAFPLVGGTAVGRGRGERLTPAAHTHPLHWVFALATGGLATADVYRECDRLGSAGGEREPLAEPHALLAALQAGDITATGAALHNDLEPAALSLRPGLHATLDAGREHGAVAALVSGSGPTCAFLARSGEHASELAGVLEAAGVCRSALPACGPVPGARVTPMPLRSQPTCPRQQ